MKLSIEQHNNGFIVKYNFTDGDAIYVFKATEDLLMIEEIAKRFLKRRIKAVEQ